MEIVLTEAENNRSLNASLTDFIQVQLPENPTTGFMWAVAEMNPSVLCLESVAFLPGERTRVGGGGIKTLKFRPKGIGASRVELKLWREWEGDASIVARFGFNVDIR